MLSCIKHPDTFLSIGFLVSVMFRGNNWGNDLPKRKKNEKKTESKPHMKQQKALNNQNSWVRWTKLRTFHSLIKEYKIKL